jgi:DMSO/TMAO reductase YedYZ molybdopterin-dependent catalytic subunit
MNDRYADAKSRAAAERRHMGRQGDERAPPGQKWVRDAPVLDLGSRPVVRPDQWKLSIAGEVDRPLTFDWRLFHRLPMVEVTEDIHCVTGWSVKRQVWYGAPARALLQAVRVRASARYVMARSEDGYGTPIAMEDFDRDSVLVATHWNGHPLTRDHGAPARLVVPHLYFWKSAKWLKHLTFMDSYAHGTWESRGYHKRGDPWKAERYRP